MALNALASDRVATHAFRNNQGWDKFSLKQYLHQLSGTQLVRYETQHTSSDWEALRVDQHARVPVEAHAAAVGSLELFFGSNYDSLLNGACSYLKSQDPEMIQGLFSTISTMP